MNPSEALPLACTLGADALAARVAAWRRLAEEHLREQADIPGGVSLAYAADDGVEPELRELARLEAECCAWADWRVRRANGRVVLEVTTIPEREAMLRGMFARR